MKLHERIIAMLENRGYHKASEHKDGKIQVWDTENRRYPRFTGVLIVTQDHFSDYESQNHIAVEEIFLNEFDMAKRTEIMLKILEGLNE